MRLGLFVLILSFTLNFGQHFNFSNYSVEDGLGQSQIYYVFQDSKGYLWAATSGGGVSRFDGNNFVNFTQKDGLTDNIVFFITEDRHGHLWFGTDKGAAVYDGEFFTNFAKNKDLNDECVWTILEDKKGNLWFGTYTGGIAKFDGENVVSYTVNDGLCHNRVFSIIQDREDNYWIGTQEGLSKFDGSTFVNYTKEDGLADNNIRHILIDNKGDLWVATKGGVTKFTGETFTRYTTKEGLPDNNVHFVLQDQRGRLWFATEGGVCEYNGTVFTNYSSKNGLSHDLVQSICEDREGNIWFGTDLGLSKFSGKMFNSLSMKDGLPNEIVWGIWRDSRGVLWLSTEKGLIRYYEKDYRVVPVTDVPDNNSAYSFFEDSKGNLWFSVTNCVYRHDGQKVRKVVGEEIFGQYEIFSIYEDSQGTMWFGTKEGGVIKYDKKSIVTFTKKEGLPNDNINAIIEDRYGNLLFATDYGISIFNGKTFHNILPDGSSNSRYALCLVPDWKENLWIGTYGGGVIKYTPSAEPASGNPETFTVKDGLSDDEVLLLAFDDRGFLYIGTNKGINSLDVKEFYASGKKSIRHYGKSEGFLGIECQQNAVYKDNDGSLWFGTIKGAIRYDHKEERRNPKEPLTNITGLKLFLEDADFSKYCGGIDKRSKLPLDLKLSHKYNHLTFEYIGICLSAPEKVRYQVQLAGFESYWTPVTKAVSATYSNLPPGDYTFKVRACNNEDVWNEKPTVFSFRIIGPVWKEWWFILSFFLMVSLGIFTYIRGRIRRLQKARRELAEKVHDRTMELKREKAKVELINLELENRVKERTEKLVKAKEKLIRAQKMEAVGTLASGVAHDLNNVLVGIVSLPELMLMETREDDSITPYLHKMKKAGKRAAAVVQDLLTLTRRGIPITKSVNLNDVVNEYLESPEYEKLQKDYPGLEVESDLHNPLPSIMGSPVHLNKVVMNLVNNAAEAMSDAGAITITTRDKTMTEPLQGYEEIEPGDYVLLSVSDLGMGIKAEDIGRIFEPFYTKKHMGFGGSGLGLTMVWGTVKDHGGHIDVHSGIERGTTISLYFPVSEVDIIPDELSEDKTNYQGRGESILVVDDGPEQREIASMMLSKLGYRVETAASGEEAVEYLKNHKVNAVMLDMIMDPGIDGCETYKRIIDIHPGQKAIIVSGYSENDRVKTARRMGAGAFLKKPYLIKEIGLTIKKELEKK